MARRQLFLLCTLLCCAFTTLAGTKTIKGRITDSTGQPLPGASIALLNGNDSTMATFGISNVDGIFTIEDAREGNYLLQVAMMGYYTAYQKITVPLPADQALNVVLETNPIDPTTMKEVVISGERVPIKIKGDTVEYNAGSFKVKPNAVVEDLLRKLPGVEVDKEGNIKSNGKTVSKVLVDGKEFFGDDPKVATKNLPAEAVDKVQSFEKGSDRSAFTGIDDGQRDQTLNLVLKDGMKTGYFGDATGGIGTRERFEAGIKAFQFRKKSQIAALGMVNNINKFGFTFQDYLSFSGGLSNMLRGGGSINFDDDAPVDFGQQVTGNVSSGSAAFNYTIEPRANNRFNISYMGNGARKNLSETSFNRNFLPGGNFESNSERESRNENMAHRLSAKWLNEIDSFHQVTMNAYAKFKNSDTREQQQSAAYNEAMIQLNQLDNNNNNDARSLGLGGSLEFVKKLRSKWKLIQASAAVDYTTGVNNGQWLNITRFFGNSAVEIRDNQFQNNNNRKIGATGSLSATRSLGRGLFLEPALAGGIENELTEREQGPVSGDGDAIDSLSPHFNRTVGYVSPGVTLRKNTKRLQWSIGLNGRGTWITPYTENLQQPTASYMHLLPRAFLRFELAKNTFINANYTSSVTAPSARQMLPYTDYNNPLIRTRGNMLLKPEYTNRLNINYSFFDQFNMSSLFLNAGAAYTKDNINWARRVNPDLSQDLLSVNTDYEGSFNVGAEYSRPIRKLGIGFTIELNEQLNTSVSPVNNVDNKNTTFTHKIGLSFNNRNNEIWDIRIGGDVTISSARYSLNKELNNTYYSYAGTGQINCQPTDKWYFSLSADITHYTAASFDAPVTVPLLKAEVSRFLLPNNRAAIALKGFDLLNRNKAIQRSSNLNYLTETKSNIIGQYFMLCFTYKLNKTGKGVPGAITID